MFGFGKSSKSKASAPSSDGSDQEGDRPVDSADEPTERVCFTDEEKDKARKWFAQGRTVGEKRNYDYAIECYITGLKFWPEAVDEGLKPLRAMSFGRTGAGGKKEGPLKAMKLSTSGADHKQAMLNACTLLSKDPSNALYMEQFMKNAVLSRYDDAVMWIGELYWNWLKQDKKAKPQLLMQLSQWYEEIADRCAAREEHNVAVEAYERSLHPLDVLKATQSTDREVMDALRNVSGKLAITKGRYQTAGDFRESMRDEEGQRDIHDADRLVQSDERLDELIAKAKADHEATPEVGAKLIKLADLLCKREVDETENEAIDLLLKEHERTKNYRFKQSADDIRLRQLGRHLRKLREADDKNGVRRMTVQYLKFGIDAYRERVRQYPTDFRVKFQLAVRLMQAGLLDEAIPLFQESRTDPKLKTRCNLYVGQCFFETRNHKQAIASFEEALAGIQVAGDELSREVHYGLGRACEAHGKTERALELYNQLLQWDYNFKDTRVRVEKLRTSG